MTRPLHLLTLGSVAVLTVLVSAGCSVSSDDYRRETEKYLESDALAKEAGYRFIGATCEEPSSQTPGTQFSCEATDNDGDDWVFVVEITGSREITVVSGDLAG